MNIYKQLSIDKLTPLSDFNENNALNISKIPAKTKTIDGFAINDPKNPVLRINENIFANENKDLSFWEKLWTWPFYEQTEKNNDNKQKQDDSYTIFEKQLESDQGIMIIAFLLLSFIFLRG